MNSSAFSEQEYDEKIRKTLPFYREMQQQAAGLVKVMGMERIRWLDTGCGTGNMAQEAVNQCHVLEITLADPSEKMLKIAGARAREWKVPFRLEAAGTEQLKYEEAFDVVTAIQAHHYLTREQRRKATQKCCSALKAGGVYITFENITPATKEGTELALKNWQNYQIQNGKSKEEAKRHISRYGAAYFPITLEEHLSLLKECGFGTADILWYSYMQAGVFGIK